MAIHTDQDGTAPSRRHRIPPTSAEAQSENAKAYHLPANDKTYRTSPTTCLKCGKRKPETQTSQEFPAAGRGDFSESTKHAKAANGERRACHSDMELEGRKENHLGYRTSGSGSSGCHREMRHPSVICDGKASHSQQTVQLDAQQSHSSCVHGRDRHYNGIHQSSSGEFSDREAVTRKVNKVLLSRSSPPPHYKQHRHDGLPEDRRVRERKNARSRSASHSPVGLREHDSNRSPPRAPSCDVTQRSGRLSPAAKQHGTKNNEDPRKIMNTAITGGPHHLLQNPLEGAKLQPKDFSEMGRRIWQTLFEATDSQYVAPSTTTVGANALIPNDMTPRNFDHEEESAVPARLRNSVIPGAGRHVRWQTQSPSRCGSRPSFPPSTTYQFADGEQSSTDGKFIRMKFGKRVKMVQLPARVTETTGDDEVQVLVRHGKSVIWRNYKTFEHE